MSVRFKGPTLRAVLVEALVNECRIILVKDQGVYFMAEHSEQWPNGRQKRLAYAFGCNPDIDSFDGWWELARTEFVRRRLRRVLRSAGRRFRAHPERRG